jgi:hypothetical protein
VGGLGNVKVHAVDPPGVGKAGSDISIETHFLSSDTIDRDQTNLLEIAKRDMHISPSVINLATSSTTPGEKANESLDTSVPPGSVTTNSEKSSSSFDSDAPGPHGLAPGQLMDDDENPKANTHPPSLLSCATSSAGGPGFVNVLANDPSGVGEAGLKISIETQNLLSDTNDRDQTNLLDNAKKLNPDSSHNKTTSTSARTLGDTRKGGKRGDRGKSELTESPTKRKDDRQRKS